MTLRDRVLSTMKSTETEGNFELYVTRLPGYLWALLFRTLHVHPIAVTLMSIVLGVGSAYFFYFPSLGMTLVGILLLVWANWFDCADGQLARMTGQKTLIGRILDGFAGDLWFFAIYLALCLRLTSATAPWGGEWGPWIWLLAAWAGLHCHVLQCNIADYYRNIHLRFLLGQEGSELDSSREEREKYKRMAWFSHDWFQKLYLFFYIRYTRRQENMTPEFQQLNQSLRRIYPDGELPVDLRRRFCRESRPLMPLCNILTFDTRVGVLFLTLLLGEPWLYFCFEILVLEPLRHYVIRRHERLCRRTREEVVS